MSSARHLADQFGPPVVVRVGSGNNWRNRCDIDFGRRRFPLLLTLLLAIYGLGLGLASAQLTSTVLQLRCSPSELRTGPRTGLQTARSGGSARRRHPQ